VRRFTSLQVIPLECLSRSGQPPVADSSASAAILASLCPQTVVAHRSAGAGGMNLRLSRQ